MPTIITAVILLLITIGLISGFVLMHKRKIEKRNKARIYMLNSTGEKLGLTFSGQEIMEKTVLGIDGVKQVLVVIESGKPDIVRSIRMADVATCIIYKDYEKINSGTGKNEKLTMQLRTIDLVFSFKESPGTITLCFYDSHVNHLFEEKTLETKARQWESLLSKMVVSRKKTVKI
jgi:hypothetical protein